MNGQSPNNDQNLHAFKESMSSYFKNAASSLTQVYAMSAQGYDYGFAQGKLEAYEDVYKWFIHGHDNTLKYISSVSFFNFINEKLASVNSKYAQSKNLKKFKSIDNSSDECQMMDSISKIDQIDSDASQHSSEIKFLPTPNSHKQIAGLNLGAHILSSRENRKRRRNPFKLGNDPEEVGEQESYLCNYSLPKALQPGNHDSLPNPFHPVTTEEHHVYIPKRKKTNLFSYESSNYPPK